MQAEIDQVNHSMAEMSLARDDLQAKVLISEQIVADMRGKEEEAQAALEENEKIMREKLDKKEY